MAFPGERGRAKAQIESDHGASIPDLIPTIARIQVRKPVIVHAFLAAEEIRMITDRVPREGLCIISRADTAQGALELQDAILG